MKKFTILFLFLFIAFTGFGQRANIPCYIKGVAKRDYSSNVKTTNHTISQNSKSGGVVIWSDNFSNASTWYLHHVTGCTGDWTISASAGYHYSTFNPPTKLNGYVGFNSDQYYDGSSPQPVMDAFAETVSPINLTGYSGVLLKFHQGFEAFNYDQTFIQFSTDGGATWPDSIEVNANIVVNSYGVDSMALNVSQYIGNQSNVKMRFRYYSPNTTYNYGGGYGWDIDDVQLVEALFNEFEITELIPSFDNPYGGSGSYYYVEGTYQYYPATSPTRLFNAAVIKNTGSNNQTNSILTVTINDPLTGTYSESSASGHTLNSGVSDDTLTVGYTMSAGTATFTNPFYLNCITQFNPPVGPSQTLNHDYWIKYQITSDSITLAAPLTVDSVPFHVGYHGNPYPNGPDLEWTYARNNQNPHNGGITPASWSSGGTDGDGIYSSFAIWDDGGTSTVPTCINYMHLFITDSCSFDVTTHIGVSIIGNIYRYDMNSSSWILQISTNQYDITSSDTGKWKQLDFLWDGSSEYLSAGLYLVGYDVTYNSYSLRVGCDASSIQSWAATYWKFAGTSQTPSPMTNFKNSPMINVNVYSNQSTIKRINDDEIIKIYPNPSNGLVSIISPENSTIKIYNLLGINVATVEHSTTLNRIDLSNLSDGNYIVKIINGNKTTTKKLNLIK